MPPYMRNKNSDGWQLLESMLRLRKIKEDERGGVKFVNDLTPMRVSAIQALKHPFLKIVIKI